MLTDLRRLLPKISSGDLDEGDIYRRERAGGVRSHRVGRAGAGTLECPICGYVGSRFLRFGLAGRRNARCPSCGSLERHRFLWLYLRERTDLLRRRATFLHTAPEPCLAARLVGLPWLRYRTVDQFDPAADIRASLTDLPLADGSVDVVLSSHVLEHIRDDIGALAELGRVLRPGGRAVIMVPFDPELARTLEDPAHDTPAARMAAYGHPFHFRIYGADLVDRLGQAGLEARIVASKNFLTRHRRRRYRINRNYLFLARKRH